MSNAFFRAANAAHTSSASRTSRLITVSIAGQPDFLFDATQGTDGMSRLSDYMVRLLRRSTQMDVGSLLGQSLTLTINTMTSSGKCWDPILLNSDGSIQVNGKTLSMNFSDIIRMVSDIIKVN
ncbi:MAG TPA: hypothetical protein VKZ94_03725 [Advenella sp.]|nr:hypothetical protein [Advenella sp.]